MRIHLLGHFLSAKNFLNDKNDFSWIYLNAKSGVFLLPRTVGYFGGVKTVFNVFEVKKK